MNHRTLERMLHALGDRVPHPERQALARLAREMDTRDYVLTGHEEVGGTLHVTFTSDDARLSYSLPEVMAHARHLDEGRPFPWADELARQGNHGLGVSAPRPVEPRRPPFDGE